MTIHIGATFMTIHIGAARTRRQSALLFKPDCCIEGHGKVEQVQWAGTTGQPGCRPSPRDGSSLSQASKGSRRVEHSAIGPSVPFRRDSPTAGAGAVWRSARPARRRDTARLSRSENGRRADRSHARAHRSVGCREGKAKRPPPQGPDGIQETVGRAGSGTTSAMGR
jgi:hypothetical protein